VALAYREQQQPQNVALAVQRAAEAVVYEAPWDFEHLQNVEQWYQTEFGSIDVALLAKKSGYSRWTKLFRLLFVVVVLMVIVVAHIVWNNNAKARHHHDATTTSQREFLEKNDEVEFLQPDEL
jgi:hypothetical protein